MAENKYTALTDEQLALQAQNGDAEAEEYLLTRFKDMVLSRAAIYYIVGGDRDDVVQEGMIGLVKAIRGYKAEQGSFSNFAYVCVTRQIISAVRSANREKHGPLNDAISLDQPVSWSVDTTAGGATLGETIPAGEGSDPAEVAIKTELLNIIMVAVAAGLSLFLYINELREFSADVIENAVKNNSYTVCVKLITDMAEGIIVAKSAVYHFVVSCIVAVLHRFKYRTEVNCVNIHFLEVRYPLKHLIKTIDHFAAVVELWSAAESERVNVIDYCVVVPIHIKTPL